MTGTYMLIQHTHTDGGAWKEKKRKNAYRAEVVARVIECLLSMREALGPRTL